MNKRPAQGFTLLETLLAIIIFTLISLTVYQAMTVVSQGSSAVNKKSKQVNKLQHVINILDHQLSHAMIYVYSRQNQTFDNSIRIGEFLLDSDDFGVYFSYDISINTDFPYHMESQVLGYRLRNNILEKLSYHLDKNQPTVSKVLDGVTAFRIRVYHKNKWLNEWDEMTHLPEGIELTLEIENIGTIRKVILLLNKTV
ncbi:type II secretion system minor pseudopilin GspJ [Yersinia kristensenii]|uniref:type II secretion system minor pseudopilin GspJ n=1 Tax=Yersinia kristensenii TaxID=28152 RepID=UPI0005E68351|nr:type II secretion system minor pseudopilin GspJ [Yersinia kristensenii]CNH27239.1 general secretion pathway protein J [Yersinia kristensenii]